MSLYMGFFHPPSPPGIQTRNKVLQDMHKIFRDESEKKETAKCTVRFNYKKSVPCFEKRRQTWSLLLKAKQHLIINYKGVQQC